MTWFDLKDGFITAAHVESDMLALLGSLTDGDVALAGFRSGSHNYSPSDYALDGHWSVDIHGTANSIYELVIKCRTVPSSNRMLVEALRQGFTMKEVPGAPELIIPRELMDDVSVEEKMIPGPRGDIRLLLYKASNAVPLAPIFLYIHGGGFCMEKPEDAELVTRKFAWMSGAAVVSIDYRLAPEHPYPCGLDDCVAGFVWLRQNADRWGLDPDRIVVGGDSAGGNLGAALTLRMRDEGKVRPPEGTLMLCPWTDMICERYASFRRNGPKGVIYDSAFCGYVRSMYSPPWLWTHPHVSPMWANLDGFGPAFILAAGHDLLADENRVFHEKLLAAGTLSEFLQHDNMPHAYYYFLGLAPEIEEAYAAMVNWLRNVLSISRG